MRCNICETSLIYGGICGNPRVCKTFLRPETRGEEPRVNIGYTVAVVPPLNTDNPSKEGSAVPDKITIKGKWSAYSQSLKNERASNKACQNSDSLTGENQDAVNHPSHYLSNNAECPACERPIECIDIVRNMPFNLGNAIKYIWRCEHKGNKKEDLQKAIWYLQDEIDNIGG